MVQCSPLHEALCVLCSVIDVGTGVMQHCDTLHENTGTLSVDGSVKISKESTTVLWVDGDVRVLEQSAICVWADSAPGSLAFNSITLFTFALICLCYCTTHG